MSDEQAAAAVNEDAGVLVENADDRLRAAARAAAASHRVDEADAQAQDAEPEAAPEVPADGDTEAEAPKKERALSRLETAMRERVEAQKARERVEARVREELSQKHAETLQQAEARIRSEVVATVVKQLAESPDEFVRAHKIDAQGLLNGWMKIASPEHEAQRKVSDLEAKLAEATKPLADKLAELEARELARQERAAAAAVDQQLAHVLTICTEEATPYLRAAYTDSQIRTLAQRTADEYCRETGETYCPFDQLVQHLESQAKREVEAVLPRLQRLQKTAAVETVKPTETNGQTKPRTLSATGASERRASPKPASEMTEAEQEQAMLDAARAAIGKTKAAHK